MLLMGYVRRRKDAVFSLVLVAALGYLSIQPVLDPRLPRNHLIRFAGEIPFRITGVVCDLPVKRSYRQVFIMRVERIGQGPAVDQLAVGRLRVTATGSIPPPSAPVIVFTFLHGSGG